MSRAVLIAILLAACLVLFAACENSSGADTVAPGPATNFAATAGDGTITLTWAEPGDADYAQLRITGTPGDLSAAVAKGTKSHTPSAA